MEQERSERLLKHLHHIRSMVDYLELSEHLLASGIINLTDHHTFVGLVNLSGNSEAMDQLIQILRLRRNGFTTFIKALRANEYNWLADQLDPEPYTPKRVTVSRRRSTLNGILKRKSIRNSEARLSGDTVFTTYRQSFPMDLSTSTRSLHNCHTLTKSFDSLNINFNMNPNLLSNKIQENTDKKLKPVASSALLLNIPANPNPRLSLAGGSSKDSEIVSKIAAEFNFPLPESLTSLKRINVASKSPKSKDKLRSKKWSGSGGGQSSTLNLKIKFKTKDARDRFVEGVNSLGFGGIRGVPLDSETKSSDLPDQGGSKSSMSTSAGWFRKLLQKR